MRSITILFGLLLGSLFIFPPSVEAQTPPDSVQLKKLIDYVSELELHLALVDHVEKGLVHYGVRSIPQEKFLIALMRLTNKELNQRIKSPQKVRDKYFKDLEGQLNELAALKDRLKASNISDLDSFVDELGARMKMSLKSGEINYKKKQVFDDALQLLYVAEDMIKLDTAREPDQLKRKISTSKSKLLSAFDEVGELEDVRIDVAPNIFNLFEEWKNTEEIRYRARLTDVKIAQGNLIKSGTRDQILRMFNNQLRYAYTEFNFGDYDLADRLLENLVQTYGPAGIKDFEDVYYYWGESNFALLRFSRARQIYDTFLQDYPNSVFASKVYGRLMQSNYKLNRWDEVLKYYSGYRNVASPTEEDYYDNLFVAALTYYQQADLNNAVDLLSSFPQKNPFYFTAQFLIGTIYASGQNYDTAVEYFQKLANSKDVPFEIYCRSLYKIALIDYQKDAYLGAIEYLSQIPEAFSRYDKVLNALAWSFFQYEQVRTTKPEERDFTQAKLFANRLLNEYYGSDYRMDSEGLLAYIYQQENKPDMAIGLYKDAYDTKVKKASVDQFLVEKSNLDSLLSEARSLEKAAMQQNDVASYTKASDVADGLEDKLLHMELAESGAVGSSLTNELQRILGQITQLRKLKEQAQLDENKAAMMKVDSTIDRLTAVLDMFPADYLEMAVAYNWFDAYPVAINKSEAEFRHAKNLKLRGNIRSEITSIDSRISVLWRQVADEKARGNFEAVALLEKKINDLQNLRKEFDSLYTETFDLKTQQPYAEFDKWGDFGAFGIIDVNFGERNRLQERLTGVSDTYKTVSDVLNSRREVIDDKLKRIEAEIRFMTMKARLEERKRMRAERERSFRETYFDKRTSEFEKSEEK